MQNFSGFTALSPRASAFALLIALSACHTESTVSSATSTTSTTSTEESVAPVESAAKGGAMSAVNIAPTISGTPATAATLGAAYSFTPIATDVNSDALTFSIKNKPTWATFNTATGQLIGTPDAAGVNANVTISVSDGKATSKLAAFTIVVTAPAVAAAASNSVLVSWSMPTLNADGTALTDLAGFHVYYGTDPSKLTRVDVQGSSSVTYSAANLATGTYYFTVAAYNTAGVESAQPAVISTVVG